MNKGMIITIVVSVIVIIALVVTYEKSLKKSKLGIASAVPIKDAGEPKDTVVNSESDSASGDSGLVEREYM